MSSKELEGGLRKVGVPSMVVTRGLVSPPFSKSWADIFLTGVLLPPDPVDLELVDRDLEERRLEGIRLGRNRLKAAGCSKRSTDSTGQTEAGSVGWDRTGLEGRRAEK